VGCDAVRRAAGADLSRRFAQGRRAMTTFDAW
jgi:hypothetical protein